MTLRGIGARTLAGWGLTTAFFGALGFSAYAQSGKKVTPAAKTAPAAKAGNAAATLGGLSAQDASDLSARFAKDIWPLMTRDDGGCIACHGEKNKSQYLMAHDAKAAFAKMFAEGHFDQANHASIIERITTTDKTIHMPPVGMKAWTAEEMATLNAFADEVAKKQEASGVKPDETFPGHLLGSYSGAKIEGDLPNTFLTYRQIRGKVQAIFGDDWRRGERDMFLENLQMFGGADFVRRFDETSKASPTFLTGIEMLGRDVASRAYLMRTGPFAGAAEDLPDPAGMKAPDAAYTRGINQLYNRMLFRDATPAEQKSAFAFLQSVYKNQKSLQATAPQDLRFALSVRDQQGLKTEREVTVHVSADTHGLYQEFVDETKTEGIADEKNVARRALKGQFTFTPGDWGQKVSVNNIGTYGNVSVQGVTLRGPLPEKTETTLLVSDKSVQPEGAWRIKGDDNVTSYEDGNENKGDSLITFPVRVSKPGKYEVVFSWRGYKVVEDKNKKRRNRGPAEAASNVRVEVVSADKAHRLAVPAAPPVPPKGEAHFYVDQTADTVAFWDLKTAFRFGPDDSVELRNEGTKKRVVADAVRLLPAGSSTTAVSSAQGATGAVVLKGAGAVGKDKWGKFQIGGFKPYNTTGPELLQDTDKDGNKVAGLSLLYKPGAARTEGWQPGKFYQVGVGFPGQVDNETRVPVVVHAQASSPIVQVVYPEHAHVGAPITVDASSTFNLQRTPLTFTWTQIGGPRVAIKDAKAAKLAFAAPAMTARQAAWEGLCRALVAHPDFLFSRPRSLASTTDPKQRRRLQLVKIAQDLVGRTPTPAELAKVDAGAPLGQMVDGYLKTPEFKDFYFHRVRLYLESHGTPEQDEPARLWAYVAFNDRPFKEILTANYTVDVNLKKQARDPRYGKTGLLTMKGFIQGKPGLPHFNYPAQVLEKFMGYVFEVPDEVINAREGITASGTTDPKSICYSCHKVLTPLAYQRAVWEDDGVPNRFDLTGLQKDPSDQRMVAAYPFKGNGLEAFATQAQNKERFIRTILQTQFVWFFGREMRFETDERGLYRRLWDVAGKNNYALRPVIKAMLTSPEYLNGGIAPAPPAAPRNKNRLAKLAAFHQKAGVKSAAAGRVAQGAGR